MERCCNQGCGQDYDSANNREDSCRYHPGAPFFHDVYKGWSCCNKKSVDFTEFLNIKGCTLSKHSNVKPVKDNEAVVKLPEVKKEEYCPPPISKPMERPPFDSEMIVVKPIVAPALKDTIDNLVKANSQEIKTVNSETVAIGTICKNSGCNQSYTGTEKDNQECQHHDGVPVFHEGMKFWSCCDRKTTDFALFMSQPGCTYGRHVWINKEDMDKKATACRYDWHQTGKDVIVSIYAKKYHYAKSIIKVNPIRLQVSLVFPEQNDAVFELDLELKGVINAVETSAQMYGTKIEITMTKAEPGSWSKLEFPRKPVKKTAAKSAQMLQNNDEKCYKEVSLDDIEAVTGVQLSELARTQPKVEEK